MLAKLAFFLMFYPLFLISLSIHEAAHAFVANRFGDPTARLLGRITLNPIAHIDWIGTFVLPVVAIFSGIPLFGWGKPVPVNPNNFRDPRRASLWVAIFGPISNIVLALILAGLMWGWVWGLHMAVYEGINPENIEFTSIANIGFQFLQMGVILNLMLAFFNMIPLFPLDGHSVVRGILPYRMVAPFDRLMSYAPFILIFLFISGGLKWLLLPVYWVANLILPIG